jgi:hypothetical protein
MLEYRPVRGASPAWLWLIAAVMVAAVVLPAFLLGRTLLGASRMSYELKPDALVIHHGLEAVVIPRAGMTGVRLLEQPTERRRLAGTALPGAYDGRWSFAETGRITLYARALNRMVVVTAPNGTWGITPTDAEGFVSALEHGATGVWEPVGAPSPWKQVTWLLPFFLLVLPAMGIVVYYIRLPASICYVIGPETLEIRGGRLRVVLPFASIEQAELASPPGSPMRVFGAGLPGLFWGVFAWRQVGKRVRLYATQYKPLVLVTAGGTTYGISPEDGDRFMAELSSGMQGQN